MLHGRKNTLARIFYTLNMRAVSLSLTPCFSWVEKCPQQQKPFQRFPHAVETVLTSFASTTTQVKQGVNVLKAETVLYLGVILLGLPGHAAPVKPSGMFASGPYLDLSPITQGWQPSTVTAIVQARDGYLWLGTYNGLMRYDGVRFTLFDSGNTPGLKNSRVTSLYEDAKGAMWIGHETGELSRFVDGHFEPVPLADAWPGGPIEAINADENNDLWLVSASGVLFRLRDGQTAQPPGGGSATRKTVLTRARSGQLWITANGQVATLQRSGPVPSRFNR